MNNTYRLIWNELANTWVAVAENAKSRGKRSAGALLLTAVASVAMAQTVSTQQLPTGGQIVSGSGAISAQGAAMTVNQNTARMITNWSSFNIGANASVNFVQPSASAVALNRIQSQDPTQIMGRLTANGQVMLVNPAGVVFGRGSQVDVGSLVASSLAISDANFLNGNYRFAANGLNTLGAVVNQGRITTANGGAVAFLAPVVKNEGQITTPKGSTLLGAAQDITVDFAGDGLISYRVNAGAANALVENTGTVMADGGMAVLSAQSVDTVTQGVVNNIGLVRAQRLENRDGRIVLEGHALLQTGSVTAPEIGAKVTNLITSGTWDASADSNATAQGGRITLDAELHIEQTDSGRINVNGAAGQGGSVRISAGQNVWVSGQIAASGAQGGSVTVESNNIVLAGAKVSAAGQTGNGGSIRIGGGYQGKDTDIVNAQTTRVVASELDVSVSQRGSAGQAIVWSESETVFGSTVKAKGGAQGGNGGLVEISSHDRLTFGGLVDATAPAGSNGRLLLDPKNIEIVASVSAVQVLPLVDPTPANSEYCIGTGCFFSTASTAAAEIMNAGVSIDRIVIASPMDSNLATNAGAVRLYNSQTGALISTLTGSSAYDYVGTGLVQLGNGNLVVRSQAWGGATALTTSPGNVTQGLGAVTFMNGSTGLTSSVNSSNSLVGSTSGDRVGHGGVNGIGVAVLTNGNYVVSTPTWSNSGLVNAGAVTWGSGTVGVTGTISSSNSLIGTNANDRVGSGLDSSTTASNTSQAVSKGITVLSNGNYVVTSPYWSGGGAGSVGMGAVTWGDGSAGTTTGSVSVTNSLVGTRTTDLVGLRAVVALSNSNYVVVSSDWGNGSLLKQGAVTWANGAGGTVGAVGTANSLIGEKAYTYLGGISYGSSADYLFNPITELAGGQYFVLTSPYWNTNAGTTATSVGNMGKGAVTRLSSTSASVKDAFGFINSTNSLVGTTAADYVGRGNDDKSTVVSLTANDTFVVASPYWNNGVANNGVGAVTWVGPTGLVGPVSTVNSLYGTSATDRVGSSKVYALANGHYVVSSSLWTGGVGTSLGAVTWGDGTSGITGPVTASNSLVGSTASDQVGTNIVILNNGNYVVGSPYWNNGAVSDAGSVTLGIGSTAGPRTVGAVDSTNSLVGATTNDRVGMTVFALPQSSTTSNYVVLTSTWDRDFAIDTGTGSGVVANVGAATWGSGTTGVTGPVSISNSLIGSSASDLVGNTSGSYSYFKALSNGNYVLASPSWNRDALADVGAVTWGSGASGVSGEISSSNSLLGTLASDKIGSYGIETLKLGNYIVVSPEKNVASSTFNGGAITWGTGSTALTGDIGVYNSFLGGGTASYTDQLGTGGVLALSDGRALVLSHFARTGGVNSAGRMDIISYSTPPTLSAASVFANSASFSQQVGALDVKASMDSGTAVTLQASNDITISSAITGINSAGHLTLQAGRSILINANITTGGANLTLKANETLASGVVDVQRDTGVASINMASGTTINAGTGSITMSLGAGTGLTNNTSGDVTLRTLTAASVSVINSGNTSGSSITANNNITASNSVRLEADYGSVTVAGNAMAAGGSAVMLARDDITINAAMTSPANSNGSLSMLAGRSVLINQAIDTKNGAITVKANYSDNTDSVSDTRLPGSAAVSAIVTNGNISAGTGAVDIRVMDGNGLTTTDSSAITSDAITLRTLTGGDVTVINDGPTLGLSSIFNPSANISAKGNVFLKASKGSISVTGITTDGTVTSGAFVSLSAMDDIANATRAITNTSSNGTVTLRAGRSINLTQNITTQSDVTISANTPYDANFGLSASRTPGAASLSITGSVRATDTSNQSFINGNVSIALGDGYGLSDNTAGAMSLSGVYGRNVNIVHNGTSGNGITLTGAVLPYGLYNSGTNALISSGSTSVVANYGSITATGGSSYGGSGDSTVVFRARDDITISTLFVDRSSTFGTDPGGLMQLLAGRSVILNSELNTKGSPLTIRANYFDNTSTVSSTRLPGDAVITMGGSYGAIRPIGGDVTIAVMDGTGLSTTDSSAITSGNVTLREIPNARNLTVTNNGPTPGSGIVVGAGGLGVTSTVGTSGAGRTGPITGLINLSTFNGDITLQGNIATASTASGAITLIAGTAASAPTTTGGEIILSGTGTRTVTTGAGGSALLFSGSISGSTGLAALATPAGTFYNVDPANMPLSGVTTGIYALFRQNTSPLTLTLNNTSMIYGDAYPTLPMFTLTSGSLNAGDSITSIAWGSAATAFKVQGTYAYSTTNLLAPTFSCAAAGCASNYSLTFVNGLTISPRPITITVDAKSMTYGGIAPALTYQITSGNMVNADLLSGALTRTAGTHAGTYPIAIGTLAASSNYAVTYAPANFVINPALLTVSMTNTGVTKTYDGTYSAPVGFTPAFSVAGLVSGDTASIFYSAAGFNDPHVLTANKVTASPLSITSISGSNGSLASDYVLSATSAFVPATITPAPVTVSSATIGGTLSKAYDGTAAAPGATVTGLVVGAVAGDTLGLDTSGMSFAYGGIEGASMVRVSGRAQLRVDQSSRGSRVSDYSFTDPVIADVPGEIGKKPAQNSPIPPTAQSNAVNATVDLNVEMKKEKVVAVADVIASAKVATEAPQMKLSATLTFGVADSLGMELVVSSNAASLTTVDSGPAKTGSADDSEVKTNSVALFNQTGDKVSSGGALSIVEQGKNMRASVTTADTAPSLNVNLAGMRFVNVDFKLPSGAPNQLSVGVSADGMLVVKVPSAMKASSDDRSLALIGMATAKERLDVQPSSVKGIVIQVE